MSIQGFHRLALEPKGIAIKEMGAFEPVGWHADDGSFTPNPAYDAEKERQRLAALPTFDDWVQADTDRTFHEWLYAKTQPPVFPPNRMVRW